VFQQYIFLGNQNSPAMMRVWVAGGAVVVVTALHCTTVPLSSAVAVNLKVEVRSATLPMLLVTFVRVAR